MRAMRRGALAVVLAAGCALAAAGTGTGAAATGAAAEREARGTFAPPPGDGGAVPRAVTYDGELVPAGVGISVSESAESSEWTLITVTVTGARPDHTFGAHVHTEPCGANPADAGPHYQNRPGAESWRANPSNEVWLDFTTDSAGGGRAVALQGWAFREGGAASLVLHQHATSTGHDGHTPGYAGPRVACFTVPFGASATVAAIEGE